MEGIMRRLMGILLLASTANAAVPSAFSVQGVLRDNTGQLQSMQVSVSVSLFDAQTAGNKLAGPFTSSLMATNGLFTYPITDANLTTELAPALQVWLEVTVGSDVFARQLVNPQLFAISCGTADKAIAAGAVEADDALNVLSIGTGGGSGGGNFIESAATRTTGSAQDLFFTNYNAHDAWMTIKASGNVGIGTVTPSQLLDVEATGGNGVQAKFGNGTVLQSYHGEGHISAGGTFNNTSGGWTANQTGAADINVGVSDGTQSTGAISFITNGGLVAGNAFVPAERMRITASGAVGIGTTTPAAALDVQTATPGLKVGATCVSGTCPSDRRLKTDIRYLSGALAMVTRLKPAAYRYKNQPDHVGYGLIAQDIQTVAPELVHKGENGLLSVDYSPLEMMLIQSTKELHSENKTLRAENEALKARLDRIEARLDKRAAR
jgi:hypothetical protein